MNENFERSIINDYKDNTNYFNSSLTRESLEDLFQECGFGFSESKVITSALSLAGAKFKETYSVTISCRLQDLCIKNDWFTCGSPEQFDKLFDANSEMASIEDIATIIWVCSSPSIDRRDIISALLDERRYYLENIA